MACVQQQCCPGVTCPPIMVRATMKCPPKGGCCGPPSPGGCCVESCCPPGPLCCDSSACNPGCGPTGCCASGGCLGQGTKALEKCPCGNNRREKRWKQCNFLKPCIDTRVYRNGEHMCISYAGHIPGEQFIHGRNLPTTTTYAKKRLCQYTPYEFIDPDGCCSFCTYGGQCC